MDILKAALKRDPENVESIMDYVGSDGKLHRGVTARTVMVTDGDDLAELPADYLPGTIAYTAGLADAWQLDAEGTWVRIIGEDEEP